MVVDKWGHVVRVVVDVVGFAAALNAVDAVNALDKGAECHADVLCRATQAALARNFVNTPLPPMPPDSASAAPAPLLIAATASAIVALLVEFGDDSHTSAT